MNTETHGVLLIIILGKEQLKGVDYIEHRVYLEKWCTSLEEYKKKVELREYMEDVNYA